MLINDLQDYWVLVSAHRRGDEGALTAIELLANGNDREGRLCSLYLLRLQNKVAS